MFKQILKHITNMILILLVFFGCIALGEFVTELVTAKSTFLNVVGFAITIVFAYMCIVAIPLLSFKFRGWLREQFKMEI